MVVDDDTDVIAKSETALTLISNETGDYFLKLGARDVYVESLCGFDVLSCQAGVNPFVAFAVECFIGYLTDLFDLGLFETIVEIAIIRVEFRS